MSNPFANRSRQLNGPASDIRPVTPSATQNFTVVAIGLYVETGGEPARAVVEKLRARVREAMQARSWPVTCSIGAVSCVAAPPSVGTRHRSETYLVPSRSSPCTTTASQCPSGDAATAQTRFNAMC